MSQKNAMLTVQFDERRCMSSAEWLVCLHFSTYATRVAHELESCQRGDEILKILERYSRAKLRMVLKSP